MINGIGAIRIGTCLAKSKEFTELLVIISAYISHFLILKNSSTDCLGHREA